MSFGPTGAEAERLAAGFGALLREARERARFTYAELSRRSRVTASTISQYERGLARPRRVSLQKLADALRPLDSAGAFAFAEQLAAAAGPSLAFDVTIAAGLAREQMVSVLFRSAVRLGLDLDEERVRAVVVEEIRAEFDDVAEQGAIGDRPRSLGQ